MVTVPPLVGWWKWRWEPVIRTKYQPSRFTILMASRTVTGIYFQHK